MLPQQDTPIRKRDRWTIYVCPFCHSDWGPQQRLHPLYCDECRQTIPGRKLTKIEVVAREGRS